MIDIIAAQSGETLQHLITLSQEYVIWMVAEIRQYYPELDINEFASEHDYDDMYKKFPGEHTPPDGGLFIAYTDSQPCDCIALARLTPTICEMRTLFVQPKFRSLGIGKQLAQASIHESQKLGYIHMRLDTLKFMTKAQTLYRSFGFYDIEPYRDMSPALKQYICFIECSLS
ncbi:MAG: GNAT family N-acetyltransferase [Anaerolineae bacterium]|nr:GNAT family N-acetyltransferase [Anaerolineae bacterium]